MLGPQVRAAIAHGLAHLDLWGRDPEAQWWALLIWEEYASRGLTRPVTVMCSGWLPADAVEPNDGIHYSNVWRAKLGPNPLTWPTPSVGGDLHYGPLSRYQHVDPPDGMQWTSTNPRRRARIPRYERAGPTDRAPLIVAATSCRRGILSCSYDRLSIQLTRPGDRISTFAG
jgi:hypothetical protein